MYKIEQYVDGRWVKTGGTFTTRQEAEDKIGQYMQCGASKKLPSFRIVRK
jgi:hypothetical protein